jgi:hypothetical protein
MRRFFLFLFLCWLAHPAFAQIGGPFPGPGTPHSTSGGSYVGPGDVSSGAVVWYGLRAFSSADRGNKAINACLPAGTPCCDMLTSATTGNLITSCAGVTTCNNTTVLCVINTWYDHVNQLGTNNCTGGTCDAIQASVGQQMVLVLNCIGTLPCGHAASLSPYTSVGSLAQAQPFLISWVGDELATPTGYAGIIDLFTGWPTTINEIFMYASGSIITATATTAVWHATQTLLNGASSGLYIDGTNNTGNPGTAGMSGVINLTNGSTNGYIGEAGIWNGDTSANDSAVNSNQRTYWGF